jgi:hypothetical protein
MDYLDPKKEFRHHIILFIGYICIAFAIVIATLVLLYQAYGFGIGKNGQVIQNSLVYFSSQPNPADIFINGKLNRARTNTRLSLPEGTYNIRIAQDGYRDWNRRVELEGGSVQHFDYPFLFPKTLTPKSIATYPSAPLFTSQSPDRRWLVTAQATKPGTFDVYDLKNPAKAPLPVTLPVSLSTVPTSPDEVWQPVEWADDNQHLLIQHTSSGKMEYLMLDRTAADQSVKVSTVLGTTPPKLSLLDKKYDRYYLFDQTSGVLQSASLKDTTPRPVLEHVFAFQSYKNDTILYATDNQAPAGKVLIKLVRGTETHTLRTFPAGTNYLLDLTEYSGTLYTAVGAGSVNKLYIYRDPIGQLDARSPALVPSQVLQVPGINYVSFSTNAQFILAEGGQQFGVYDIENKAGYKYATTKPLDQPIIHASWMDGDRLTYVSGGKTIVFDYDNKNEQVLLTADSRYLPAFSPNYRRMFQFSANPAANGQTDLTQTELIVP